MGFIGLCSLLFVSAVWAGTSPSHLYTTGKSMEIDRCASAWLIKRYVDRNAKFRFYPEDSLITEGTVFDRPEGVLHRTHNKATFEVIADKYNISFPGLKHIAASVHDAEVNFWGGKQVAGSGKLAADLKKMIRTSHGNIDFFKQCFGYFDQLLKDVQRGKNAPY